MKTELSRVGHEVALITSAILSTWLDGFDGPSFDEQIDITGIKSARRALDSVLLRLRKVRPDFPRIEKGPVTIAGVTEYAARVWGELVTLERVNIRLDFVNGVQWLIPDLPTKDMIARSHPSQPEPRKLDGAWIYRTERNDPKSMSDIEARALGLEPPIDSIQDLGRRVQELGLLDPSDWTFSQLGSEEMIGIRKRSFARIVEALIGGVK